MSQSYKMTKGLQRTRSLRRGGNRSRKYKKHGGSVLRTAVVPFGILALQRLLARNSKSHKHRRRRSYSKRSRW